MSGGWDSFLWSFPLEEGVLVEPLELCFFWYGVRLRWNIDRTRDGVWNGSDHRGVSWVVVGEGLACDFPVGGTGADWRNQGFKIDLGHLSETETVMRVSDFEGREEIYKIGFLQWNQLPLLYLPIYLILFFICLF